MANKNKRVIEGVVVGDKMTKTRVLLVTRQIKHPIYKKLVKKSKKFLYHDETETSKLGDHVSIIESRKFSKRKSWRLLERKKPALEAAN